MTTQSHNLPKRRTGGFMSWLDRSSIWRILVAGLLVYSIIPIVLALVEAFYTCGGNTSFVKNAAGNPVDDFWELLYFNFITILTVGYGDYSPVSIGRLLSVFEAIAGVVLFGVLVAVATLKAILPPKDAVIFSKYGDYCIDDESFLVIFVNTTSSLLVNPEMCSYYRQGEEWYVRPAYRAPFIGGSVWTFFVENWPLEKLVDGTDKDNALRFGLTAQLGLTMVSACVEYEPTNILVIPNRNELVAFDGFRNADLARCDVRRMFHYCPKGSESLKTFVQRKKAEAGIE